VAAVFDVVRTLNGGGVTILLVEQNARKALAAAHRGYVLEVGSVILSGRGTDLLRDPAVQAAYLGGA
jgi:ABC-type branched-subunit amino acid transport system ATPase component